MKKNIYKNVQLSNYSWFNLGGPAKILFKPKSESELSDFLKESKNRYKKFHILGAGSNTLFRDSGFDGVVIKLGKDFAYTKLKDNNKIEVGAATLDKKVSDFASSNSLSGFEFLSCIPGSIGGTIAMNSGCYGYDISQLFVSLRVMDFYGKIKLINKDDIKFFYRGNNLKENLIFLSAVLRGNIMNKDDIESKKINLINQKKKSQPSKVKTCGSTFKNPENTKAWKLIKTSNCSNLKIGGATMSSKHSNFFLNNGNATSSDIENLISEVQGKVFKKTGIKLELEIKIIGGK
tara:strand:- start:725 stop:1597 length:873 start_codon:yes stop_codon:yes gene_type:complete